MASPVIDIDVGGKKVRTMTSTLQQVPYLEALLRHEAAGTMDVTKTEAGLIFIDRSPELFMKVMEGLRAGGKIFTESACEAAQLLNELAFLGLDASCPQLNAWEKSATQELFVRLLGTLQYGDLSGLFLQACASQTVLNEVRPVLGYGEAIVDEFGGHQLIQYDFSRHQVNTCLASNGKMHEAFWARLPILLGELGFEIKSQCGSNNQLQQTIIFSRKKLEQRQQPFIINVELVEQFEATCEGPFRVGVKVLAHSLQKADLNGAEGTVVRHKGDRVVVKFQDPIGEKALKRKNLLLTTAPFSSVSATVMSAASVHATTDEGSSGPQLNDGQSSLEHASDIAYTSGAQIADNPKNEVIEPDLQEAIQESEQEALLKEQADVAQAIFESNFEPPDGVVLRLTNHHDVPEVREALMTAEALDDCRRRVTDAGCELSPAWGNGAMFLLPFREQSKYQELQPQGVSLEELKPYNIVALREDEDRVKQALTQVPRRRRPQCKREGAGSAGKNTLHASAIPGQTSGETFETETGMAPDSAREFLPEVQVEIVRTFYTFYAVTEAQASEASGDSRLCRSAPVVKHEQLD